MNNNIRDKINYPSKNKEKALDNKESIQINSEANNKNWKKQEKKGKNMAIFTSQKLYSPVISRNYFSKIKKSGIP